MRSQTITKRFSCLLLALVLAVPAVSVSAPAEAAAKAPTLSVKKKTVTGVSNFTIKVKAGKAKIIKTKWSTDPLGYVELKSKKKTSVKVHTFNYPLACKVKAKVKYKLGGKVKTTTLTSTVTVKVKNNAVYKPEEGCFEYVLAKEVSPLTGHDKLDVNDPSLLVWDEQAEMMAFVSRSDFLMTDTFENIEIKKVVLKSDNKTVDVYVDPASIKEGVQYMVFSTGFIPADGSEFKNVDETTFFATVDKIVAPAATGSAASV